MRKIYGVGSCGHRMCEHSNCRDWGGLGAQPFTGLDRGNVCISTSLVVADSWVVPIFPRGIGFLHRLVAWSFVPAKITVLLYHTLHFLLSNMTLHPALHKGQIPIREAIFNDDTMCPINICGRPGIWMSQMWVDSIVVPSGKFILSGFVAIRLLLTSALSMMNIDAAPVSAMALFAAMVSAFKYCGIGGPNMVRAVAAIKGCRRVSVVWVVRGGERLDVTTVTSSTFRATVTFNMRSKYITFAETK
jgi:hypothetical protein